MNESQLTVTAMNENHARLCPSPEWAQLLHSEVLPTVTAGVAPDDELLELGPGPGASFIIAAYEEFLVRVRDTDPVSYQLVTALLAAETRIDAPTSRRRCNGREREDRDWHHRQAPQRAYQPVSCSAGGLR